MMTATHAFPGFSPDALKFLKQLKRHNDREWFVPRKAVYEEVLLAPMRAFVEEMDVRFASFAPEIIGNPKRSIFRLYRDTRFSKDKTPYKTHIACWFQHRRASHGVGSETHGAGAGYYFHLEPGASLVAGGIWMPPRESVAAIRERIALQPTELARLVSARTFRERFGALNSEHRLTRVPRGYATDHPAGEWLRYASFTTSARLTDEDVCSPTLARIVEKDYQKLLPMVRWLNSALGYPPDESR